MNTNLDNEPLTPAHQQQTTVFMGSGFIAARCPGMTIKFGRATDANEDAASWMISPAFRR
jgi:hypothetical protein